MTVRLYDSRAQAVVDFVPLEPGRVGVYVCGPTVQSSPHIGHLRSALVYDVWRRWLSYRGFEVTLVRNVTDIDDKVLDNALEGEPWWALAYRVEQEFSAGYAALGILPPSYEPRATASIPQMIEIIERLIDRGHAYPADDGSSDVYFDTASWSAYGTLTRQRADDMVAAADSDARAKRDPRDFALWKGHKPNEPESASWASPWGAGRPGWHIECSAMSSRYLGAAFDIHGGGLDLRFPHHENELAQSSAAGDGYASYWVHNGLVTVNGQKMSKSLGNSLFAAEFLVMARPLVIRYFLGSAHYRSTIDYHDGALLEAEAAVGRIESFLARAQRQLAGTRFAEFETEESVPEAFVAAMDDDLAVPQALAVVHETVRSGNAALDSGDLGTVAAACGAVLAMTEVLGINPLSDGWRSGSEPAARALGQLVESLIKNRNTARAAKDFAEADRIRDELAAAGIVIEDGPSASHWELQ